MALPFALAISAAVGSALAQVGNFIMQAIRTVSSIPWRRIFFWALLGLFIAYFSAVLYSLVTVSVSATRMVFGAPSMSAGRPSDISGFHLSLSSFWTGLPLPSFWRFFMWFIGLDWFLWLAVNFFHFWLVGYLLERFSRPIGTLLHKALESL